jgi:hypothetical protein
VNIEAHSYVWNTLAANRYVARLHWRRPRRFAARSITSRSSDHSLQNQVGRNVGRFGPPADEAKLRDPRGNPSDCEGETGVTIRWIPDSEDERCLR